MKDKEESTTKLVKRVSTVTKSAATHPVKITTTVPPTAKPAPQSSKNDKHESLDKKVFEWEEQEAIKQDSAEHLEQFSSTCNQIRKVVTEMNELKKQPNSTSQPDMLNRRIEASLLMTDLKKMNRLSQIRGRNARENTQAVKARVDGRHLQLQNLLYEVMHMQKEIEQCIGFTSRDEEIDLISAEQFSEQAPDECAKLTTADDHQRMLARLDWELQQRKRLALEKSRILERKKLAAAEISQKNDYLVSLKPKLDEIMTTTLPVQEFMGMPIEAERLQFELAGHLPRPLYIMYVQMKAYRDACDQTLIVDIQGDAIDARAVNSQADRMDDDVDVESAAEEAEETEAGAEMNEKEENKRRKRHKEKKKARHSERSRALLKRHPLSINTKIKCESDSEFNLSFFYIPAMKICTVEVSLTIGETRHDAPVLAPSSLLSSSLILRDLLSPDDHGLISPNPSNNYQLEKLKMGELSSYLSEIGQPYYWVQWLCGLNYLPNEPITSHRADDSVSFKHLQKIVKAIQARLSARLALQHQLAQFEKLEIPPPLSILAAGKFPSNVVCQLTSWKSIGFTELGEFPFTSDAVAMGMVDESSVIYHARITREEPVDVIVIIYDSYPSCPPLMLIGTQTLESESPGPNQALPLFTTAELKSLECEVNAYAHELLRLDDANRVLANQMRRLQVCYDLLVETGSSTAARGGKGGTRERLYTRRVRGRDRNRPYLFHEDGYFVHR